MSAWTDEQAVVVAEMAAAGRSAGDIARHFGVTRNAVIGFCHRRGVQLSGSTAQPIDPEWAKRFRALAASGMTTAEIGAEMSMSYDIIRSRAKTLKIGLVKKSAVAAKAKADVTVFNKSRSSRELARKEAKKRSAADRSVVQFRPATARPLLEASGCRWPLWGANTPFAEKHVCGQAQEEGGSYCPHHASLAYRQPDDRRAA